MTTPRSSRLNSHCSRCTSRENVDTVLETREQGVSSLAYRLTLIGFAHHLPRFGHSVPEVSAGVPISNARHFLTENKENNK